MPQHSHQNQQPVGESPACKPGSVGTWRYPAAHRTVISLDVPSPTRSSSQPAARRIATPLSRRAVSRRLFGLAPAGVCRATCVTTSAVGSYPTLSPLPWLSPRRFTFCCAVRHAKLTPHAPRRYLATCPMEPGLSSAHTFARARRDRPADDHPLVCRNIPARGAPRSLPQPHPQPHPRHRDARHTNRCSEVIRRALQAASVVTSM